MQMTALSPVAHLDEAFLSRLADWLVVLIAIALPWSTTATAICIVAWLVAVLPSLEVASVRRELQSAAGGLPVLLWCLGVIGMLWADVTWTERFHGLGSFHRLLVVPLLLAQFQRSEHGTRVICAFLISSAMVLIASYVLTLTPGLTWRGPKGDGIAAHDDIFQGSLAVICGFGTLGYAGISAVKRRWQPAFAFTAAAAVFLSYFLFVSAFSRVAVVVAVLLTILLGWRIRHWKGLMGVCLLAAAVSVACWLTSASLRERVHNSIDEFREYSAADKDTPIGQHVAFLKESLTIISSAPVLGHGTGSITKEFGQVTSGKTGAAGVFTVNPHNQTFAVAIQIGLLGAIVLWSMWIAHLRLFRGEGAIAWIGTVIVIENIISSTVHSHLFDSAHGWLYVFGVGVLGGMALRQRTESSQPRWQKSLLDVPPLIPGDDPAPTTKWRPRSLGQSSQGTFWRSSGAGT
jgi:O-antigen ligase